MIIRATTTSLTAVRIVDVPSTMSDVTVGMVHGAEIGAM